MATILGSGIVLLDGTVVNVALPTIQRALGGGLAAQQWVVNGYLLTLGSLILVGGSLGDLYGERRVFAIGVGGLRRRLACCARSRRRIGVLVAARALQGIAGALLVPSSLAVIVNTFPPTERGAAIGSWTAWGAIAGVLGPLAGGELLAIASWRWIFVINVPLAVVCVWLILTVDPRERAPRRSDATRRRIDFLGALLCALGLGGPVFALIEQPRLGWSSPAVFVPLIARRRAAGGVPRSTSRARSDPMLPLRLFRRRNFSAGNVETFAMYAGLAILFFFLVLFLQQIGGYSPLKSGLATLPVTVMMFLLSRRFGALADRLRAALLHGRRPARRGRRAAAVPDDRREGRLRLRSAAAAADVLARAVDDRRAADGSRAGRRGERRPGSPRASTTPSRASPGCSARRPSARRSPPRSSPRSTRAWPARRWRRRARGRRRSQAPAARHARRARPAAGARRTRSRAAAEAASLHSFHLGMMIAAVLVALGGVVGPRRIRNPRRAEETSRPRDCAGRPAGRAARACGGRRRCGAAA